MSPELEERRGREAQIVLQSPVYQEAYKVIRDNIITQLSLADLADDRRKKLNDLLVALSKVDGYMKQVMAGGKMAADQLERERTFPERIRDRLRA
jgi:hypothetical protein